MIPFDSRPPAHTNPIPSLRTRTPAHDAMRDCVIANVAFQCDEFAELWGPIGPDAAVLRDLALAQFAVSRQLAGLSGAWTVLHSIPLPAGGVLPLLVIGPGGVFAITAAPCRASRVVADDRTLLIDGEESDDLRAIERIARLAARVLSIDPAFVTRVVPVVAVVGAERVRIREASKWVAVVDERDLVRWLCSRGSMLQRGRVKALAATAADPFTWGLSEERIAEPPADAAFWALHARVLLTEPEEPVRPTPIRRSFASAVRSLLPTRGTSRD